MKLEDLQPNTAVRGILTDSLVTVDYAEAPPFGHASGNWTGGIEWVCKSLATLPTMEWGSSTQADASKQFTSAAKMVSTDPLYYDNVRYADLSNFFYVWLRRTLAVLKAEVPDALANLQAGNIAQRPCPDLARDRPTKSTKAGLMEARERSDTGYLGCMPPMVTTSICWADASLGWR